MWRKSFRRFCDAAGFSFDTLAASAQDHHTEIRRMTAADCGVGITRPKDRESVDGLVTNEPGVTLVTYYADCTPLFFFDPVPPRDRPWPRRVARHGCRHGTVHGGAHAAGVRHRSARAFRGDRSRHRPVLL